MRTFKDSTGQSWEINLAFGDVLRVKAASEGRFLLLAPDAPTEHPTLGKVPLQAAIMLDVEMFWELLFYLVEPQCQTRGIDAAKFGELMAADCVLKARDAFREEWRDFFEKLQRPDQALALEKIGEWLAQGTKKLQQAVTMAPVDRLDAKVKASLDKAVSELAGRWEEL